MIHTVSGWRYRWRRYLGWFPIQFCMVCGKWYWGGFPELARNNGRWRWQWMPWWKDYCSRECSDEDLDSLG